MMATYEQLSSFVMPFGKHKGKALDEVPLKYLDWLVGEFDDGPVKTAVKAYLEHPSVKRQLEEELDV